jgi:hypothetical protein
MNAYPLYVDVRAHQPLPLLLVAARVVALPLSTTLCLVGSISIPCALGAGSETARGHVVAAFGLHMFQLREILNRDDAYLARLYSGGVVLSR